LIAGGVDHQRPGLVGKAWCTLVRCTLPWDRDRCREEVTGSLGGWNDSLLGDAR
jgi:hypothetical protein